MAIDSQGNLFITDGNNHRVQKFDLNGKFVAKCGQIRYGQGRV